MYVEWTNIGCATSFFSELTILSVLLQGGEKGTKRRALMGKKKKENYGYEERRYHTIDRLDVKTKS